MDSTAPIEPSSGELGGQRVLRELRLDALDVHEAQRAGRHAGVRVDDDRRVEAHPRVEDD